jgi:hypothetical protein
MDAPAGWCASGSFLDTMSIALFAQEHGPSVTCRLKSRRTSASDPRERPARLLHSRKCLRAFNLPPSTGSDCRVQLTIEPPLDAAGVHALAVSASGGCSKPPPHDPPPLEALVSPTDIAPVESAAVASFPRQCTPLPPPSTVVLSASSLSTNRSSASVGPVRRPPSPTKMTRSVAARSASWGSRL